MLTSIFSVWSLGLSCPFAWCICVWLFCPAVHNDSGSASLRTLFPQQDRASVSVSCHQECLRNNAAAEASLARRDDGPLKNSAKCTFLIATLLRRCSVAGWKKPSGVHRGACSACYQRSRLKEGRWFRTLFWYLLCNSCRRRPAQTQWRVIA